MVVHLVAMAVALVHLVAINALRQRAGLDRAALRTEAHRAAQIGIAAARLHPAVAVAPFGDQRDDRVFGFQIEFGAVRVSHACNMPRILDHRELHSEADAQIRYLVFARKTDCGDLAFRAALAETARYQDRIEVRQTLRAGSLDVFRIDVFDIHPGRGMDAAMANSPDPGEYRIHRFGR